MQAQFIARSGSAPSSKRAMSTGERTQIEGPGTEACAALNMDALPAFVLDLRARLGGRWRPGGDGGHRWWKKARGCGSRGKARQVRERSYGQFRIRRGQRGWTPVLHLGDLRRREAYPPPTN